MAQTTNARAVTAAVMMATFLAALETTVVGTAMPTIIGTLGGLALYSWVFSSYLLASTTTVPVYGRLADMYGRKPVFVVGATIFLLGSALCGASTTMEQLVLCRAIQGLGAGAILPVSMTVVGDIFSLEERARVQGLLSGVWGVSAILGPAAGGLIVDHLDWRWVFYLNIPFGLVSILLFALHLRESVTPTRRAIDYVGVAGLTAAVTILIMGILEFGQSDRMIPVPPWSLLSAAALLLGLFLWHESRIEEPLLPLTMFGNRVVFVSNATGFLSGAVLLGVSSYVPTFVQGVMGGTAVNAGATLAPVSIGWLVGSILSGRLIALHGYRPIVLMGMASIAVGSMLLLPVGAGTRQLYLMMCMAVIGLGMGFSMTSFTVAVQSAVQWGERGIATASIQFFRTIGGAIGVSALGALMNSGVREGLATLSASGAVGVDPSAGLSAASAVLDPVARAQLPMGTLQAIQAVLASSLHTVYTATALVAVLGLALTFLFPHTSAIQDGRQD